MKAIVFDMDGTLITESSWELLHSYFHADLQQVVKNQEEYFSHEIDYETWMQKDMDLWDCPSQERLEDALSSYTLEPFAQEVVASLKSEGVVPCIVSSGIGILARIIGERLGIRKDCICANEIICENGALKGVCHVEPFSKDNVVLALSHAMSIPVTQFAAVGDAAPDISLFRAAALTFAYKPKDTIIADSAKYIIDDLRTILHVIKSYE
jgi:HAD superfamily PSPase-like hydrolase